MALGSYFNELFSSWVSGLSSLRMLGFTYYFEVFFFVFVFNFLTIHQFIKIIFQKIYEQM